MRKIFAFFICTLLCIPAFAQNQDIDESEDLVTLEETEEENESTETVEEIPEKPTSIFIRYFQEKRKTAIRNDFILSSPFFMWSSDFQGMGLEFFSIHWSFLPFTSLGAGLKYSGFFGKEFALPQFVGLTLQAGIVAPITQRIKAFADGVFDIGYNNLTFESGIAMNFGFDFGTTFMIDKDLGIELKYSGLWIGGKYTSAINVGWLWNFWM